ncbi:MAG TPA: hypothetical protein VLD61_10605, partial [Methylomirabilota bacterium]|nr:hypothetical protein [Methylomirabilota bacterium]
FEARHEDGGFVPALVQVFQHREIHHVWANTIAVAWALLGFNALAVLRRRLGEGQLSRLFLAPLPEEAEAHQPSPKANVARQRKTQSR